MLPRYDANNDPWQHLNDPAVLNDTPIGHLRVITWARAAAVARVDLVTGRVLDIIHTLERGENPLAAVYGKRTFERKAVQDAYDARDLDRAASEQREQDAIDKDNQDRIRHFVRKHEDGAEAVVRLLGFREA